MPEQLRFDGRVAIVTGAGAGLGRSYALLLAERGASVIVNDLGGGRDGDGKSTKAADTVVNEIRNKGGKAAANYNSVVDGEKIVQTALENFGRVDIVINNAGILRDRSFARISDTDWNLVHDVHLKGAFKVSQAAWPHMKKQNYGRIVMTSSNSGLLGNFGQANYSAAKMGLVGLSNTLAIEGAKNNIHCNVIVPTAASRLTEDILPPDFFEELRPDLIAPVVAWLCHEECEDNGVLIDSAVGWAAKCHMVRGEGTLLRQSITQPVMLENVKRLWTNVTDMSKAGTVDRMEGTVGNLLNKLNELKNGPATTGAEVLDFIEGRFSYTNRDAILYALGVGATTRERSDLKYLYEGHEDFAVLPSYGIIPGIMAVMSSDLTLSAIPGKDFDLSQVLHGEQFLTLHQPLPTQGDMISRAKVIDVMDKGKNAVIVVQTESYVGSEHISTGQSCVFIVGGGGFGGKRLSSVAIPCQDPPRRSPDASLSEKTSPDQAALYRLSGDVNPLHIDPDFARMSGYKTPILHGLCSLGFAIRAVLRQYAGNDPELFQSLKVRFSKPVLPGQTLRTDMWREGQRVHFQTSVAETDQVVISGAYVDLKSSVRPSAAAARGPRVGLRPVNAAEELVSQAVFDGMKERVLGNPDLVKKVNGVFVYVILKNGKKADTWTADLRKGKVYKGEPEAGTKTDTTITVEDGDLVDIALGKLNAQSAFMKGKLKIKGNLMLTQKLKLLMAQESKL